MSSGLSDAGGECGSDEYEDAMDSFDVRPATTVIFNQKAHIKNLFVNSSIVNAVQGAVTLQDECASGYITEFKNACDESFTAEVCEDNLQRFQHLSDHKQQVHPKMVVTEFYRGHTAADIAELRADPTYLTNNNRNIRGVEVKMEGIHGDAEYAAMIADAGAGKTTLAKRYSLAVDKGRIPMLRDVKIVRFINLAKLYSGDNSTFMETFFFRFLKRKISEDAKMYGSLWIQSLSKQMLLVFDGLDQVDWVLKKAPKIALETKAHPSVILYNLLHEDLLPGCKVLLTSREFAITRLPQDVRPQKVIALNGLFEKDMKSLIKQLAPRTADGITEQIFKKSPALRSLCCNPMFLIFTTAILAKDTEDIPENLSGVLMKVLRYFVCSENQRVENIREILEKLCTLALEGMKTKKFVFAEEDMVRNGLSAEQVQDLVIMTPETNDENHYKLMEGSFRLFFCHQSVQEALAAIELAKHVDDEFKQFVWERLHESHWEVVLRILVGIKFHKKTCEDARTLSGGAIGGDVKKQILAAWLIEVVERNQEGGAKRGSKRMKLASKVPEFKTENLCSLLFECGDGAEEIIRNHIRHLNIPRRIRADQLHAVSWVMSRCRPGIVAELVSSNMDCSRELLVEGLKNCKMAKVDLTGFRIDIKNQKPINSGEFINSIGSITLTVNSSKTDSYQMLGNIIGDATVEELSICKDKMKENGLFTDEQIRELKKTSCCKVERFHVFRKELAQISNTRPDIFGHLGEVAKQCNVKRMLFGNFKLSAKEDMEFRKGCGDLQVEISSGKASDYC